MSIATTAPLPTIVFAAMAAIALAGCGIDVDLGGDTVRRIERDEVAVRDLRSIEVTSDNGSVDVRGGADDVIAVRADVRERDPGDADLTVVEDGDRLVVTGRCDDGWWERCSVDLVVTVPDEFDVEVATDNGRVDVADVDGDVELDTDNGAITATGLGSQAVSATTDNGRVQLSFDESPVHVDVRTDNGAVLVGVPADAEPFAVDADSDNGTVDVSIATDREAGRRIDAHSDNGSIEISSPRS